MISFSALWHVVAATAFCVTLLVVAPTHNSSGFVFTDWTPNSDITGISSPAYIVLVRRGTAGVFCHEGGAGKHASCGRAAATGVGSQQHDERRQGLILKDRSALRHAAHCAGGLAHEPGEQTSS